MYDPLTHWRDRQHDDHFGECKFCDFAIVFVWQAQKWVDVEEPRSSCRLSTSGEHCPRD